MFISLFKVYKTLWLWAYFQIFVLEPRQNSKLFIDIGDFETVMTTELDFLKSKIYVKLF